MGAGSRLTYVGHSTVLIEIDGVRVLTDPLLRSRLGHLRRRAAAVDLSILEGLDAVVISHVHHDHLDLASLRLLDRDTALVVPSGATSLVRRLRFREVVELSAGESLELGSLKLAAVPARHRGRRLSLRGWADFLGYVLSGSRRAYFAGDTELFDEMADFAEGLDLALLPVWGWGSRLGPGHLDPRTAAEALPMLRPRIAVPIHWGTFFPLAARRRHWHLLSDPPREFERLAAEAAPQVQVRVLEPGDSLVLEPARTRDD